MALIERNYYIVEAKDGKTAKERFAAMTKEPNSFYRVDDDLYLGDILQLNEDSISDWAKASTKPTYTKSEVGLGNVVNTGDSSTPVSGGTTKFTTGGAYTELAKKVDKTSVGTAAAKNFTTSVTSGSADLVTSGGVKSAIDTAISSVLRPAGSVAFANLPALTSSVLGNVYNVTDAFTTTSNFIEGAGKSYPANTNVAVVEPTSGTYKFDVLSGFIDLSGYALDNNVVHKMGNETVQGQKTFNNIKLEDSSGSAAHFTLPNNQEAIFLNPIDETTSTNLDLNNFTDEGIYKFICDDSIHTPNNLPDIISTELYPKAYVFLYVNSGMTSTSDTSVVVQYLYAIGTDLSTSDYYYGKEICFTRTKDYNSSSGNYIWSDWNRCDIHSNLFDTRYLKLDGSNTMTGNFTTSGSITTNSGIYMRDNSTNNMVTLLAGSINTLLFGQTSDDQTVKNVAFAVNRKNADVSIGNNVLPTSNSNGMVMHIRNSGNPSYSNIDFNYPVNFKKKISSDNDISIYPDDGCDIELHTVDADINLIAEGNSSNANVNINAYNDMSVVADGIYLNPRSDGYGTHVTHDIFTVGNYQRSFNRYGYSGTNKVSAITSGYLNSGGYRGYNRNAPSQFPQLNIPDNTIANYASAGSSVFGTGCIAVEGSAAHAEGNNSIAIGGRSHAEGNTTLALGHASHAEGLSTLTGHSLNDSIVESIAAHAEGIETWARNSGSHAEGRSTYAVEEYAHAEGYATSASGAASHAEGKQTDANGQYSHAEGLQTTADQYCSHAEGYYSGASGDSSHAEGFRTTAEDIADHSEGVYTIADSNSTTPGHHGGAHAGGYKTQAYASGAFAHGYMDSGNSGTTDWGSQSVDSLDSDLRGVLANGLGATAFGYKRKGILLKSSGHGSFATGCVGPTDLTKPITETQIRNFYAVDFGIVASGDGSFAGGYTDATREMPIKATGKGAFAYGYGAKALGDGSVAIGYNCETHAAADGAVAIGHSNGANYTGCCALGYGSVADNLSAFAAGNSCQSNGYASVAMGAGCTAMSECSITLGYNLTANQAYLTTVGKYNKASSSSTDMLIVGKGTASNATANCFRVNQTAIYSTGSYNTSGADYAEMFEWADENVNAEDRRGRFVKLDEDKIVIADNIDDEILGIVSGNPSVCGDVQDDQWQGMYMYDIFGKPIYEDVEVEQEHYNEDTGEIETIKVIERQQKLNPEYDNTKEYIPRSERPEWDAVGMLGKLTMVDDGTCEVNEYAAPSIGGIATKSDTKTRFRVMKRLDSNHVKILILN